MNFVITGVSKGLGAELCEYYLNKGHKIFGIFRTIPEPNIMHEESNNIKYYKGSIVDEITRIEAIKEAILFFGKIDVLINNAGVKLFEIPENITDDQYEEVMNTNLTSQILLSQVVIKEMIKYKTGHIINISSRAGMEYSGNVTAYSPSKAGLIAYSISLSEYLKKYNVGVNVISPPTISTRSYKLEKPALDHSRFIRVESIIKAIDYIISSKKLITGLNFPMYSYKSFIKRVITDLGEYMNFIKQVRFRI